MLRRHVHLRNLLAINPFTRPSLMSGEISGLTPNLAIKSVWVNPIIRLEE